MAQVSTHQRRLTLSYSSLLASLISGVMIGWLGHQIYVISIKRKKKQYSITNNSDTPTTTAYEMLIGRTPCILLPNISQLIQREIYVKLENYNPGGSGKDRAAYNMIMNAEIMKHIPTSKQYTNKQGNKTTRNIERKNKETITPYKNGVAHKYDTVLQQALERSITGGIIIEGTSGSTGISLAHIAIARGHACIVVLPDDQAKEKQVLLQSLGALFHVVPTASISSPNHYVNIAKAMTQRAVELGIKAVFIDQFNNTTNYKIHYQTTGPEIWNQCQPHAFVMSAGTGGTIAGVAKYLKKQDQNCFVVLADPIGSVLCSKVECGVAFTSQQKERTLLRHRYDTIAEGIGLDRITDNVNEGLPFINCAVTINDQDAIDMAHYVLREEGLMIGSSTSINIVAAIQTAQRLPPGSRICTIICDSGQRHVTRFWNRDFILSRGLLWPYDNIDMHYPQCLHEFIQYEDNCNDG